MKSVHYIAVVLLGISVLLVIMHRTDTLPWSSSDGITITQIAPPKPPKPPKPSKPPKPVCHPLLLMIEGGGGSSLSEGTSIEDLAVIVNKELNNKSSNEYRRDITVIELDNGIFWKSIRWITRSEKRIARLVERSGFWPIVIVGHSMGGDAAYNIASKLDPSPPLLVTFDPVSNRIDKKKHARKWINVYDTMPSKIPFTSVPVFPVWGKVESADKNIGLHMDHKNVNLMYRKVEKDIKNALNSCPYNSSIKINPKYLKYLCKKIDGVDCLSRKINN